MKSAVLPWLVATCSIVAVVYLLLRNSQLEAQQASTAQHISNSSQVQLSESNKQENGSPSDEHRELLRLRGEVALLRREAVERRNSGNSRPELAESNNISADVINGRLMQALDMYKGLARVEYVTSSNVILGSGVVSFKFNGKSPESALDIIRRAVLLQTGIVITPIDGKRASVTFNDAFVPVIGKLEE